MRRRPLAASLLLAMLIAGSMPVATLAEGPASRTQRPGLPPPVGAATGMPDGAPPLQPQAAPGVNGVIAYSFAWMNVYPFELRIHDAGDDFQVTNATIGYGDMEVAWSPGGTMLAFSRDMTMSLDDEAEEIFLVRPDGTGLKQLTSSPGGNWTPDWYPDGSRIVFASSRSGDTEIYSMRVNGTDIRQLTDSPGYDGEPTVSPDGTRIAFTSTRAGTADIWLMDPDGTNEVRLVKAWNDDYAPDWSPDGSLIAFTSTRASQNNADIYTVGLDGVYEVKRTGYSFVNDQHPSWSPDGASIVHEFFHYNEDTADIAIKEWDGGKTGGFGDSAHTEWDPDWQPVPDFPLVDARFSPFETDIEWVYAEGITVGCSPERYCPDEPVTREQMAIFLDRALDLPATATDYFTDDTGRSGEAAINRLRAAGITAGCTPITYCPTANVTRGQMASFLARAFDLPATTTDYFTDDATSTHQKDINRLAASGITSGCSPTTYCPNASVTRGQMAAFLRRALD